MSEQNFLGSGMEFPLVLSEKKIKMNKAKSHVRQAIITILRTRKGERVMRPEFGCDLNKVAFMEIDTITISIIKNYIEEALNEFEPRIDLIDIDVQTDQDEHKICFLNIKIKYVLVATNTVENLVYPFYLERGE